MIERKFKRDNDNSGWANWGAFGQTAFGRASAILICGAIAVAVGGTPNMRAQDAAPTSSVEWLTGRELERARELAISVRWSESPVRAQLRRLAQRQRIGALLDRRLDPSTPLNLVVDDATWDALMWRVADALDASVVRIGQVDFVTPSNRAADQLAALLVTQQNLQRARRSHEVDWLKRTEWSIPEFAEPRALLAQLAREADVALEGLDGVPHDVWPAWDLPPTSLMERMALVLAPFDLWFRVSDDGRHCEIVPLDELGDLKQTEVTYTISRHGVSKAECEAAMRVGTGVSGRRTGQRLVLRGTAEEVLKVARAVALVQVATTGETRQSLAVTASRGQILATMANQLGVKLAFDPDLRSELLKQVTLDLKDVTEGDIIEAALDGSGFRWELNSTTLRVYR